MDNNGQLLENQDFSYCFISKCVFASIDSPENINYTAFKSTWQFSIQCSIRGMWTVIQELEENLKIIIILCWVKITVFVKQYFWAHWQKVWFASWKLSLLAGMIASNSIADSIKENELPVVGNSIIQAGLVAVNEKSAFFH